jgi:hypothetical protein
MIGNFLKSPNINQLFLKLNRFVSSVTSGRFSLFSALRDFTNKANTTNFCWRSSMILNLLTVIICCAFCTAMARWCGRHSWFTNHNIWVSEISPSTNGSWPSSWARLCQDIIDTEIVFGGSQNCTHLYLNNHQQKWPRILTFKRPPAHNAKGTPWDLQVLWNALLIFPCSKQIERTLSSTLFSYR